MFTWPQGTQVNTTYTVCAQVASTMIPASPFQVLSSSPPSVSVNHSSYKVGDNITVTGANFYPSDTTVTLTLESVDGGNSTTLSTATFPDSSGSFSRDFQVPDSPTGTVVIVATAGSGSPPPLKATSSQFTIHKKGSATPTPTPKPTSTGVINHAPTASATPTLAPTTAPTASATPTSTGVINHAPTPAPSPTIALAPTPVPTVINANTPTSGTSLKNKLPAIIGVGLATLFGLGILFAIGWLLLRRYRTPVPPLYVPPPSNVPPWMRSEDTVQQQTMLINGDQFGQMAPFGNQYPPGNGGYAPNPGYEAQHMPYNGPFVPNDAQSQQVPYNDPYGPGGNA